jgi:hypothetical protein
MSQTLPLVTRPRSDWAVPAGLLVATFLLVIGGNLAGNGVLTHAAAASTAIPGWEQGSLLRVLAVWMASWLSLLVDPDTGLVLVYVLLASVSAIASYRALRGSDWPAFQALLALCLVAGQGTLIYAVTTASPEFLLILAAGILIPARRRLEAVGDVQSVINYGLTLPLLLMAGPPLSALIPLLVLAVPLREPEARRKPQVFGAMLLVAIVPALIIIAGVWAMAARAGIGIDAFVTPFGDAFARVASSPTRALLLLATTAPVALILIVHLAVPDRRRKLLTTMLAVLLPLYLLAGNSVFDWQLASWTPAAAMLACGLGWLCSTRLRPWMRWLALGLLLASLLAGWSLARLWAEPAWLAGLMPLRLFSFNVDIPGLG